MTTPAMTTCHYCGTDCSGRHELTILGPRQSGKSHVLVMMAVEEAAVNDGSVAYVSCDRRMDSVRFADCLERAEWLYLDRIERAYRANGAQRIVFKGGGVIRFITSDFGREYDLCCLDDVPAERMVKAKRSIRAALW
jgi:hypothetical protein